MKKKASHAKENSERWLLTYSDLITLLLVFFVVMYSISKADVQKFKQFSASMQKAFNVSVMQGDYPDANEKTGGAEGDVSTRFGEYINIQADLSQIVPAVLISGTTQLDGQGAQDAGSAGVEMTREGIRIWLPNSLLFDPSSATLRPEADDILSKFAERWKQQSFLLRVEGHTDNIPPDPDTWGSNWQLSAERSVSVVTFLVSKGVDPQRLTAAGRGEFAPIADNSTRAGRARNRRAEIIIIYPEASPSWPLQGEAP